MSDSSTLSETKIWWKDYGRLPSGWSKSPVTKIFDFLSTNSLSRSSMREDTIEDGTYNIHYGDIHAKFTEPILDFDRHYSVSMLAEGVEIPKSSNLLKNGDLIIADASEDYAGVGQAIEISNLRDKKAIAGLHTFALRDKNGSTSAGFRSYTFRHNHVAKALKVIATGSKVYGITKTNLAKLHVVLPPIAEQKKIAKIMGTWDKAITNLEQLIEQKEKLKKGLMQQLLTGKKRFPEFTDVWKIVRLNSMTKIYDGTHTTPNYTETGVPFYSVEHLTNNDFSNTKYISEEVFEKENKRVKLEKGDILMTRIGDIGTAKLLDWDVRASFYVSLALIKANNKFDSVYLEQYLNSSDFHRELHKRTIHVAFPKKINLGEIGECIVQIPSLEEQLKIGVVLKTADNEILNLKKALSAIKEQKTGLMQQLLTGKVRVKIDEE